MYVRNFKFSVSNTSETPISFRQVINAFHIISIIVNVNVHSVVYVLVLVRNTVISWVFKSICISMYWCKTDGYENKLDASM